MTERPRRILPVVTAAQFGGTSLWFAGNAVVPSLEAELGLVDAVGPVTSAVQVGFIGGTALLAVSGLADRFEARAVFLGCAIVGAAANLGVLAVGDLWSIVGLRFVVGLALAGVYPIGMKAAAGWYAEGLGRALGYLVGALVLGTAFPHLLGAALPWRWTLATVSGLAVVAGVALYALVPDGPHIRTSRFDPRAIPRLMRIAPFRGAALGYFGHMWELYTFWAFVPALIALRGELPASEGAFLVIASGAIGCVAGGLSVPRFGSRAVAAAQLAVSGACCLALPFALALPPWAFLAFLVVWGITVVGDSPQYSAISARSAPPELVGTGLTLVTSVGFALTVPSIAIVGAASDLRIALAALAVGPILGLLGLRAARVTRTEARSSGSDA